MVFRFTGYGDTSAGPNAIDVHVCAPTRCENTDVSSDSNDEGGFSNLLVFDLEGWLRLTLLCIGISEYDIFYLSEISIPLPGHEADFFDGQHR